MDEQEIIFEDENLAVFNKPPGVNFDWVVSGCPELIPVHRLDKDTSGVILFAKNIGTADYLKSLFEKRKMQKTYLALVAGKVSHKEGVIALPIARSAKDFRKRVAYGKQGREREARTDYKVIQIFKDYSLVEAHPKTGRTHQIRAHFSAIGHPVSCDRLYGGRRFLCPQGISRQFLHAKSLEFVNFDGTALKLEADLPEDLQKVLDMLT